MKPLSLQIMETGRDEYVLVLDGDMAEGVRVQVRHEIKNMVEWEVSEVQELVEIDIHERFVPSRIPR